MFPLFRFPKLPIWTVSTNGWVSFADVKFGYFPMPQGFRGQVLPVDSLNASSVCIESSSSDWLSLAKIFLYQGNQFELFDWF